PRRLAWRSGRAGVLPVPPPQGASPTSPPHSPRITPVPKHAASARHRWRVYGESFRAPPAIPFADQHDVHRSQPDLARICPSFLGVLRPLKTTGYLAPLVRAGLIMGIVLAAAAFPLVAIGGIGALAVTDTIDRLPDKIRNAPSAQVSYVYASDGKTLITQFYEEYRRYVPFTDISPHMLKAIVASEDTRFFEHDGVDQRGVVRAFLANYKAGEVSQGASTRTMQYVRNVQRDSATSPEEVAEATEQSNMRKLREMRL